MKQVRVLQSPAPSCTSESTLVAKNEASERFSGLALGIVRLQPGFIRGSDGTRKVVFRARLNPGLREYSARTSPLIRA